jgi:hypothetical protein
LRKSNHNIERDNDDGDEEMEAEADTRAAVAGSGTTTTTAASTPRLLLWRACAYGMEFFAVLQPRRRRCKVGVAQASPTPSDADAYCWGLSDDVPAWLPASALAAVAPLSANVVAVQVRGGAADDEATTAADLSHACWIVANDCVPAGGFEPAGVPGRATVFGIALTASLCAAVAACVALHPEMPQTATVLYHGSSTAAIRSILTHGPCSSSSEDSGDGYNMLGDAGFYGGSVWKACRFGGMTQGYLRRPTGDGAIVRCLLLSDRIKMLGGSGSSSSSNRENHDGDDDKRDNDNDLCMCAACRSKSCCSSMERRLVHHDSRWKAQGWHGVHLPPLCIGTTASGAPRYIAKNDEWCVDPAHVVACQAALLDCDSLYTQPYQPLQRDQRVLLHSGDGARRGHVAPAKQEVKTRSAL